ncbi:M16 family metallopeptidase [Sulfidibacter corallicola]|uniref:Insulinase family protein n=1 Tax=Sulfidibacter corallicola TaxID=2818388 RepID=A0A8A4TM16_SULCO|nr:pitrilysin family protein [Sulfidibacter corallicola]QTD49928.1 insulinase family protein [Sulfidibacter corallicola]
MRPKVTSLFPLLCALLALVPTLSAQTPESMTEVRSLEGITEYAMKNGLRVLLFPDPTKETITVNITYLVGSKHENYGETGMAHLLEHLVFKGTPKHPNIPEELTERGARPNGTTWTDRTNYYETFHASDDNLEWALELEADRMVNSFIYKKDLDSEMTVVRNEFERGENNPFRITLQRILSSSYMWHNYGKSTIGARSDIENVPIDRLQAFYRKYYQPDNAVLVVAGKFEKAKALNLIHKYFAPLKRPERVLPQIYTTEPTQDGEREITLRRTGDLQLVAAAYHIPAGSHPEFAAVGVLTQLLSDDTSGRLHKALVEKGLAAQIMGLDFQWAEPGVSIFGAVVPKDKSLSEAHVALLDTLENIAEHPVTEAEVTRAKAEMLKNIQLAMNSSETIGLFLSEWIGMGDWRLFFLYRDRLEQVTVAQVQAAAKKYLRPSNRTVGRFIPTENPERAEIPATPDVQEMLKDYKGKAAVAMGEAFDPSPENIESRTERLGLEGGLKLALLPKKTRGESVHAHMNLYFGDEKNLAKKSVLVKVGADMLMRGTQKLSRDEIQSRLAELKATIKVNPKPNGVELTVQTVREHFKPTMALAMEILREPAFPEKELELYKQESITVLESGRQDPAAIIQRESARAFATFHKDHPLYGPGLDEEIDAIQSVTTDQLKAFHKAFYGVDHATLAVVGDFDKEELVNLVVAKLDGWKSKKNYEALADPFVANKAGHRSFETPDKANAVFMAGFTFDMTAGHEDFAALRTSNFIFGGGVLNSRLARRIRQKEGLSYGVGSRERVRYDEPRSVWFSYAIAAPENMEKLEAAFREEVERIVTDGVTEDELNTAKSGMLQRRKVQRSQDNRLAGLLCNYMHQGRTLAWDAEFESKIQALTPGDVHLVVKKYLDVNKMTVLKAGDFAKVSAAKEAQN